MLELKNSTEVANCYADTYIMLVNYIGYDTYLNYYDHMHDSPTLYHYPSKTHNNTLILVVVKVILISRHDIVRVRKIILYASTSTRI